MSIGSSLNANSLFQYRDQIAPLRIFSLIFIGGAIAFSMEIAGKLYTLNDIILCFAFQNIYYC